MPAIHFKEPGARLATLKGLIEAPKFDAFCVRVSNIVQQSFRSEQVGKLVVLPVTQAEIKRRAMIVYEWYIRLRCDFKYSHFKALDFMNKGLEAELMQIDWEPPPAEQSWTL